MSMHTVNGIPTAIVETELTVIGDYSSGTIGIGAGTPDGLMKCAFQMGANEAKALIEALNDAIAVAESRLPPNTNDRWIPIQLAIGLGNPIQPAGK